MRRILISLALLMLMTVGVQAGSTFSGFPAASQPLGNVPDYVPLDQGTGCLTGGSCTTSQSPSLRIGQPIQTPPSTSCAAYVAPPAGPFLYQQCVDNSTSPPVLKEFYSSTWWPVFTFGPGGPAVSALSSPFTLGTTLVTTTGTQLNYLNAATGTTGTASTNIVFSTGATLSGPTLTGIVTIPGGETIQAGNMSGSTLPYLQTLIEGSPGDISSLLHGIYPTGNSASFVGISSEFNSSTYSPGNGFGSGATINEMTVLGTNTGTAAFLNGIWAAGYCTVTNGGCSGGNLLALAPAGSLTLKLVGMEIDQQFGIGNIAATGSAGLYINTFNVNGSGNAIQFGATNGYWTNGIGIAGVSTSGAGLFALNGQTMDSLVNFSSGVYTTAAAIWGNGQAARFSGTGANPALIKMDSSNNFDFFNTQEGNMVFGDGGTNYSLVLNAPSFNYYKINPATTGNSPVISAVGGDGNINAIIEAKGTTGAVNLTANGIIQLNASATTVTINNALDLPGIANAAGNEILCYNTAGGIVTYEAAVASCVPSDESLKTPGDRVNPFEAMWRVAWYLRPSGFIFKETARFGVSEHVGFYAQDVCLMDNRLCIWDAEGVLNYDKTGLMAYLTAALEGITYSLGILIVGLFFGLLAYGRRTRAALHRRLLALEQA